MRESMHERRGRRNESTSPANLRPVDDDELRAFLGSLGRMGMGVPSGYVGIARLTVQEAGRDLAAVDAWVERHGGEVVRSRVESKGLGRGRWHRQHVDTSHYLIPADELPPG